MDVRQIWRLGAVFRRENFDIVHTHLSRAHILGAFWGQWTSTPMVGTLHSTGEERRLYNRRRFLAETWALKYGARRVIAVGHSVAGAHRERLAPRSVDVIPNAVTPVSTLSEHERTELRRELTGATQRPLLIAVGRLLPPKAYPDLLTAMRLVIEKRPDAYLAIVGGGEAFDDLLAQIKTLSLSGNVALLGERGDVPRLLAAADLFVSSSQREGLPLAVLEAMSAGLPVVATAVGDLPRLVTPQRGVLVPVHQPKALADALLALLADTQRARACGMAGKAYVLQEHDPQVWVNRLLALYEQVLAERHTPKESQ